MDVKLLNKTKDQLSFTFKGEDISYANVLRRLMLTEVPVMAIEDVELKKNSSALYDEMISHRLGLIPLKTDLKSYNLPLECKCKGAGCAQCTLKLTLKVTGPKMVYASDLRSKDPKVKPVFPKTPIVKLLQGQELQLVATAVLGQGKDHMKFSPGLIYYKLKPTIKITKQPEDPQKVADSCPVSGLLVVKNKKLEMNSKKEDDCILCNACVDESKAAVEIKTSNEYIFYIESWGQLSPKDIGAQAIDVFNKQLKEFVGLVKKI
ncbi:MAG: DNA-directed RNA polymerase subunit D [archaeon]